MSTLIAEGFAAWRECREAYAEVARAQFERAEEATKGALLNARGREQGIDSNKLFTSNALFRNAYASEELQEHWRDHPHLTFAAFEKQWEYIRDEEVPYEADPPAAEPQRLCKHCGKPIAWTDQEGMVDWAHVPAGGYGRRLWGCYEPGVPYDAFAEPV